MDCPLDNTFRALVTSIFKRLLQLNLELRENEIENTMQLKPYFINGIIQWKSIVFKHYKYITTKTNSTRSFCQQVDANDKQMIYEEKNISVHVFKHSK